jgi:uncharacterized protein YjcR
MVGTHERNTQAMRESPRCGARTRKGTPCQAPAVAGKTRCRMHGGAAGSGAPKGNRNAVKHGLYTSEMKELCAEVRGIIRQAKGLLDEL